MYNLYIQYMYTDQFSFCKKKNIYNVSDRTLAHKNQFLSPIVSPVNRDFLFFSALPRKIFPGFSGKIFWIFLSSFHVCRQCSPVQIKYVSFADEHFRRSRKLNIFRTILYKNFRRYRNIFEKLS